MKNLTYVVLAGASIACVTTNHTESRMEREIQKSEQRIQRVGQEVQRVEHNPNDRFLEMCYHFGGDYCQLECVINGYKKESEESLKK